MLYSEFTPPHVRNYLINRVAGRDPCAQCSANEAWSIGWVDRYRPIPSELDKED